MTEPYQRDFLTGFFLRDGLHPYLEGLMLRGGKDYNNFSIVLIDIDRFKKYNDTFGHAFGDKVLEYVASIFRMSFNEYKCKIFRYGGDEFIFVILNKRPNEVYQIVENCAQNFRKQPFFFKGKYYNITISCGIANYPLDALITDDLIRKADNAMYFSKTHGRNLVTSADKIKFLKLRRTLILVLATCVTFLFIFFLYKNSGFMAKIKAKIKDINYSKIIPESISSKINMITRQRLKKGQSFPKGTTKNTPLILQPRNLAVVVLKDGRRIEGYIVKETEERIELKVNISGGQITMNLDKTQIDSIERE